MFWWEREDTRVKYNLQNREEQVRFPYETKLLKKPGKNEYINEERKLYRDRDRERERVTGTKAQTVRGLNMAEESKIWEDQRHFLKLKNHKIWCKLKIGNNIWKRKKTINGYWKIVSERKEEEQLPGILESNRTVATKNSKRRGSLGLTSSLKRKI